jgi:hypothetical protein
MYVSVLACVRALLHCACCGGLGFGFAGVHGPGAEPDGQARHDLHGLLLLYVHPSTRLFAMVARHCLTHTRTHAHTHTRSVVAHTHTRTHAHTHLHQEVTSLLTFCLQPVPRAGTGNVGNPGDNLNAPLWIAAYDSDPLGACPTLLCDAYYAARNPPPTSSSTLPFA